MQQNHRLPPSLKEMMFASGPFRILFWTAVACVLASIVLGCLSPIVHCRTSYSCSYYFSSNYYQCTSYGQQFCCSSSYNTCGDNYCIPKPTSRTPCWGLMITTWVFSGLALLLSIAVFIMFCNLKNRRNLLYFNPQLAPNYYNQQPFIYAQPIQEYPQYHPQQQNYHDQLYQQQPIYQVPAEPRNNQGEGQATTDYQKLNQH